VIPKESLDYYYGRLAGFLRGVSLRLQLLAVLESLLLLTTGFILILLGSLCALELGHKFPYLSFLYNLTAIVSLCALLLLGLWRAAARPSMERVARGLEEKFPHLCDDVTNSLLLFNQLIKGPSFGHISQGLIAAQIRKTVDQVSAIEPGQVVNFRKALRHLRLLIPLVLAFSVVLTLDPHFPNRSVASIFHPFSALPSKEVSISLEPKGLIALRGTTVMIRAKAEGKALDGLMLAVWPEGSEPIRLSMVLQEGGNFTYRIASAQSSFRYQAYHGRLASPVYTARIVDPPEVGKVKLTLVPPDYTGLPTEVKEEGNIEALKGTVVNLQAWATKGVREGKIILSQGNQLLLKIQDNLLIGSLLIFYPGTYSLHVKDDLGFENPNPVHYQIRLLPDKYPEAEIISPAQDLEVSGAEVMPIVYLAKDDFGITSVRLTYQMGAKEHSIGLKNTDGRRAIGPETYRWDLSALNLTAGDRVVYRLEVYDNDSFSGPKIGYSRAFSLSVKDERTRAAEEGEEAHKIADALLELLADQLEATRDREALTKEMEEILKRVDRHVERMGDRTERFDVETLRRNLAFLKERISEAPEETVIQEMERLALLAEDIAKRARMNEVEAMAREIKNRQRRLIDFLQELKGPLSPKDLQAAMKELKKLEELLRSFMEALSRLANKLPDEFMNSPELQGLNFQDLFQDLEKIGNRLMAGDLKGALEAAQRLLQALSEMMAALGRAGSQAGMSPFDRLQGQMSQQTSELDKILDEQREILRETERIDKDMKRMVEEETEKKLSHFLPRLKEVLEEIYRSLLPEQGDLMKDLELLLKEGRLERFSHLVKEMEKEHSGTIGTEKLRKELRQMAESLDVNPKAIMTRENREKFPPLSSRQESLKERTEGLEEKLKILAQLFPGMDTKILNDLKEGAGFMGEASGKLKGEDAPGAIPPEEEAIKRLSRSHQAMQRMTQQMAMRMQAARWGYPLAYDPRPGWYYGPWVPMPTLPQPELNRPRERGYTGIDREEFDPPSKDAYRVPEIFREKILESLKEGIPSPYRREVEKYFRGLTE